MKRYRKKILNKEERKKSIFVFMLQYLGLIVLVCIFYLCYTAYESHATATSDNTTQNPIISKFNFSTEPTENTFREYFLAAQRENPEVIGWISITDTDISEPLLQTTNNEFYLTHNYKKENSNSNSTFLHKDSVLTNEFSNLIMYMSNELLYNYNDKNFFKEHKELIITTDDKEYFFTLFAVIDNSQNSAFQYNQFISLDNKTTFTSYIANCKKYQLYTTGVSAVYGNQVLTLVSGNNSQKLVLVGKKLKTLSKTIYEETK